MFWHPWFYDSLRTLRLNYRLPLLTCLWWWIDLPMLKSVTVLCWMLLLLWWRWWWWWWWWWCSCYRYCWCWSFISVVVVLQLWRCCWCVGSVVVGVIVHVICCCCYDPSPWWWVAVYYQRLVYLPTFKSDSVINKPMNNWILKNLFKMSYSALYHNFTTLSPINLSKHFIFHVVTTDNMIGSDDLMHRKVAS